MLTVITKMITFHAYLSLFIIALLFAIAAIMHLFAILSNFRQRLTNPPKDNIDYNAITCFYGRDMKPLKKKKRKSTN